MFFANLGPELILANLVALGIGMTIHEFAHSYVGFMMGDPEPARAGRLTLNPFVHINWMGWLMFAIIGFGILGSAPISPYRMRNPRWGYLAAVAAGPLSNLLLAVAFAVPLRMLDPFYLIRVSVGRGLQGPQDLIVLILIQVVFLNLLLFFFNILPLFPIDGWHIVLAVLPPDLAHKWQQNQQTSQTLFFVLIFASFVGLPFFGLLIGEPTRDLFRFLVIGT